MNKINGKKIKNEKHRRGICFVVAAILFTQIEYHFQSGLYLQPSERGEGRAAFSIFWFIAPILLGLYFLITGEIEYYTSRQSRRVREVFETREEDGKLAKKKNHGNAGESK